MEILLFIIIVPLFIVFSISIYNYFYAPLINGKDTFPADNNLKISILIPARNEEKRILPCLESLSVQTYKNMEVIILDDNSNDGTYEVVQKFIKEFSNFRIIKGLPLKEGWSGKNWACNQLLNSTISEIVLFLDADVVLNKLAIEKTISRFVHYNLDMLSSFPTQIIKGFGPRLVIPLMNWLLLSFLPLKFVYTSKNRSFVAANGQFIMIKKEVLSKIGGYEILKNRIVEDMEMARLVKINGYNLMTVLGGDMIFCKMYENLWEAIEGFSKNFYAGFNINPFLFVIMVLFFEMIFLLPFFLSFCSIIFLIAVIVILIVRILISLISNQGILANLILHPLQFIILLIVGIRAISIIFTGKGEWKGRKI